MPYTFFYRAPSDTAPKGYRLTMTVDGGITTIKAGDYKGKIILKVTKIS